MKRARTTLAILAALLASPGAATRGDATPLFAEDAPLEIVIEGPLAAIARKAPRSVEKMPARIEAGGESHAISLSARGNTRRQRDRCRFPPLMLDLESKPGEGSLFHRQNRMKLVTHCRDGAEAEQTVLREYAAYRLYSALTPASLRARLVRATYSDGDSVTAPKWGFLIEDADDAARRVGLKEVDSGNLPVEAIEPSAAARYVLFQYLIGNTDWSMVRGADPGNCCHNSKLLGPAKDARSALVPLPYDFDNAGLVDAPYAFADPTLRIRTVRTRVYRGFCRHDAELLAQAQAFREARPALEAEIDAAPGLDDANRRAMRDYLDGFFADIADDARVRARLLSGCRG